MIYLQVKDNEYISLKYAKNDKLVEEKNGRYDIEFEYPLMHHITFEGGKKERLHNLFQKFALIKCDTPRHKQQLFFITDIQKLVKGVKIYAKHIGFLSKKLYVPKFSFKEQSCSSVFNGIKSTILDSNKFSFYSDIADIHTINMENKMLFDVLLSSEFSISTLWQGTYLFDNYKIKYLARRGKDTEYIVANRKNVNDINIKQDADNVVTRLYMKANKRTDNENEKDVIFETVVESPLINEYPYILADFREYEDSFRTLEALKKYGEDLFKVFQIDLPKESFSLVGTDEINSYNLDIDDTCIIYYEDYNIHKRIDVVGYIFSPMEFRYLQVDFGYKLKSLSDTLLSKTDKKIKIKNESLLNSVEGKVNNKINEATKGISEKIEKTKEEIEKETKKEIEKKNSETKVAIEQILQSIKTNLEEEIEKAKKYLDEEKIKALSNAETQRYIRTKEGQQELINSITADVVWLKAIVTDTEILNTIVANIDLAKIKKLNVDTAFIEQIISKEEFKQQFEDMGANVTNIFSKLKNSITLAIQTKFNDKWGEIKSELNTALELKSNEIISTVEKNINEKVDKIKVGARNLLKNSATLDKTKWQKWSATNIEYIEITDNDEWRDYQAVKFSEIDNAITSKVRGYYLLDTVKFEKDKTYTLGFDVINLSDFDINFAVDKVKLSKKIEVKAKENKRVDITFNRKDFDEIMIAVETELNQNPVFCVKNVKVEEGNKATSWTPAIEDLEEIDKQLSNAIEYLSSDNKDLLKKYEGLNLENAKIRHQLSTQLKQTRDEFLFQFNNYKQLLDETGKVMEQRFNDFSRYIRFKAGNIELGDINSSFKTLLTHEKISFFKSDVEVAYISNNKLYITDAYIINSLRIGNFEFVVQENGNLSFRKAVD